MITLLFRACDRVAAFFGYVPVARVERARRARAIALRQGALHRERSARAVSRECELERTLAALEAEVIELRRTAGRVAP